ncbi:host specificity protein (plasmid) [Bradyrhizobium barranii]|uniref:Host specificity protein n=1 Tax=Bradyrhizobium barranii TaxID=2992140 RepID=A0ABY3R158_9BRAD|nr:host specificity protein [Bradyrhizobium japonicum]UFW92013.1 host specificity protein [Bradyrhizobium japonicum]
MPNRVTGSSSQFPSASQVDESEPSAGGRRFTEALAGAAPGSSSGATRPYSVVSEPPIDEIDRGTFRQELRNFYGNDVKHIADNPQEYSDFVSEKAERTAMVARAASTVEESDQARYFSYQLGDKSVGLLKTEGRRRMGGEAWEQHFPGRKHVSSVVGLRVTHPLVENAGDILLEHQLRLDGKRALVLSRPATDEVKPRLEQMGFVHVGDNQYVLDPRQQPDKWTLNEEGKWQRADKPRLYLSKAESSDDENEGSVEEYSSEEYIETDSSADDPSWYFDRLNLVPGTG